MGSYKYSDYANNNGGKEIQKISQYESMNKIGYFVFSCFLLGSLTLKSNA